MTFPTLATCARVQGLYSRNAIRPGRRFWAKKYRAKGKVMKMNRPIRRLVSGLALGVLMLTVSVLSLSTASSAGIGIAISVRIGPPALPVYAQPICPGPGYLWTPGYWAWNDDGGYYWVPGTWMIA